MTRFNKSADLQAGKTSMIFNSDIFKQLMSTINLPELRPINQSVDFTARLAGII